MRIDEIEARLAAIRETVETRTAELSDEEVDALTEESRKLNAERKEIEERAAKEAELRKAVAPSVIAEIKEQKEDRTMQNIEIRNTHAYIDAYANYVKTGNDAECRALLTENADTGVVPVPELVYEVVKTAWDKEGIMSLIHKSYIRGNLKIGFERSADAAVIHTEGGEAVTEEELTLGIVTLVAQSIKKWISVSDETLDLAGEAFLRYVYDEVAYQIAKKAADTVVASIEAAPTTSTATAPAVPKVTATTIAMGTVAAALSELSDEAANPVIMMNKKTYAAFKAVQYANGYGADPFEGLTVVFNNTIKAFSAATTGQTYAIVGDLNHGALANFPRGEEIGFKFDDKSLAEKDLVKIIGREFVAIGVIAPNAFVKIVK